MHTQEHTHTSPSHKVSSKSGLTKALAAVALSTSILVGCTPSPEHPKKTQTNTASMIGEGHKSNVSTSNMTPSELLTAYQSGKISNNDVDWTNLNSLGIRDSLSQCSATLHEGDLGKELFENQIKAECDTEIYTLYTALVKASPEIPHDQILTRLNRLIVAINVTGNFNEVIKTTLWNDMITNPTIQKISNLTNEMCAIQLSRAGLLDPKCPSDMYTQTQKVATVVAPTHKAANVVAPTPKVAIATKEAPSPLELYKQSFVQAVQQFRTDNGISADKEITYTKEVGSDTGINGTEIRYIEGSDPHYHNRLILDMQSGDAIRQMIGEIEKNFKGKKITTLTRRISQSETQTLSMTYDVYGKLSSVIGRSVLFDGDKWFLTFRLTHLGPGEAVVLSQDKSSTYKSGRDDDRDSYNAVWIPYNLKTLQAFLPKGWKPKK